MEPIIAFLYIFGSNLLCAAYTGHDIYAALSMLGCEIVNKFGIFILGRSTWENKLLGGSIFIAYNGILLYMIENCLGIVLYNIILISLILLSEENAIPFWKIVIDLIENILFHYDLRDPTAILNYSGLFLPEQLIILKLMESYEIVKNQEIYQRLLEFTTLLTLVLCLADMLMMIYSPLRLVPVLVLIIIWQDRNREILVYLAVGYSIYFGIILAYQARDSISEGLGILSNETQSMYFKLLEFEKKVRITEFIELMSCLIPILIAPIYFIYGHFKGTTELEKYNKNFKNEGNGLQIETKIMTDGRMVIPDLKPLNIPENRTVDICLVRIHAK